MKIFCIDEKKLLDPEVEMVSRDQISDKSKEKLVELESTVENIHTTISKMQLTSNGTLSQSASRDSSRNSSRPSSHVELKPSEIKIKVGEESSKQKK